MRNLRLGQLVCATAVSCKGASKPLQPTFTLHYHRAASDYDGWTVQTTAGAAEPSAPVSSKDGFGAVFTLTVATGAPLLAFSLSKGGSADAAGAFTVDIASGVREAYVFSGYALAVPRKLPAIPAANQVGAHLLARDTLAWDVTDPLATSFELRYSATAGVAASETDVTGGSAIPLTPRSSGIGSALAALAPHLAAVRAFDVAAADLPKLKDALKGQLVAVARKADGKALRATAVQTAFALDDLYAYDGPLGVTFSSGAPTFLLWAPTAQAVKLHVYDAAKAEVAAVDLTAGAQGVWSVAGQPSWNGLYYRYELDVYHPTSGRTEHVKVTDPYSVNLSTNGLYSQIVDLADPALRPAGWDALAKPALDSPTDIVVYEAHLRDFSANDATVAADRRGKYLAFVTEQGAQQSNGLKHLAALAAAGLTHVHLLPVFDFATVDEDPANRVDIDQPFDRLCAKNSAAPPALCTQFIGKTIVAALASFPGDSDQQQAIAGYMHDLDSFNWGYDPFHYGAPEGSYASTAEGTAKIVEFRRMVRGLSDIGLRTIMDVVYNHTNASGLGDKSVLDKVVPGYYHRLDPDTGFVESSTCCANTATEHHMMERLMIDTLVRWARDYKVDGFRFDLMGHHMKVNMQRAQAALQALTVSHDGVDGSKIYLYGEGWDFGEVAKNARGANATQLNLAGTGIGTFNDRLRDAARGGSPFDSGNDQRKNQGPASGLFTDPNELVTALADDQPKLAHALDLIKIGMAGSLADFPMLTATGSQTVAGAVGYNGAGAGYTQLPQESLNYVSGHDNQILWDIAQYKLPAGRSSADRVRAHNLALDVAALAQGVPLFQMGDDLLRSKSMEHDSFDSGDWFNRIDWTGQSNGWKSGLPNAGKDLASWPLVKAIFGDPTTTPSAKDIAAASAHFVELLKIRKSTRLLRLSSKADVLKRVDFLNAGPQQVPGVIVMTVTDGACAGADLDPARDALVVIVNHDRVAHTMTVPGASGFTLHAVQQASADPVVRTASAAGASFTVPARTTAVFEQLQGAGQGAGLACNAH